MAQRHQPCITLTQTEVGFKHIVTAWRENPHEPTLGFKPNGALVWTHHGDDYFERDSLAALSTVLTQLRTITNLDNAIATLRRDHPYPQRLVTVAHSVGAMLDRLRRALPLTWRREEASAGLVVFQHDPHGHIAVRASGTEAATRLYIEAPAATLERLTSSLAEPCPATSRLSTQK
jgi:phosphomannomutase